jgi:hypothetical protein
VAPAEAIRSQAALARHVRYVALNPCRKRLAGCPLAWPWSTHRDVLGACVDPWVTAARMRLALGGQPADFLARHHAYVSADPHAEVAGTPFPLAAPSTRLSVLSLREIIEAVMAATRAPVSALEQRGPTRSLFVALAYEQAWDDPERLAAVCSCRPRTIRSLARLPAPLGLAAARLCLGDARLRDNLGVDLDAALSRAA